VFPQISVLSHFKPVVRSFSDNSWRLLRSFRTVVVLNNRGRSLNTEENHCRQMVLDLWTGRALSLVFVVWLSLTWRWWCCHSCVFSVHACHLQTRLWTIYTVRSEQRLWAEEAAACLCKLQTHFGVCQRPATRLFNAPSAAHYTLHFYWIFVPCSNLGWRAGHEDADVRVIDFSFFINRALWPFVCWYRSLLVYCWFYSLSLPLVLHHLHVISFVPLLISCLVSQLSLIYLNNQTIYVSVWIITTSFDIRGQHVYSAVITLWLKMPQSTSFWLWLWPEAFYLFSPTDTAAQLTLHIITTHHFWQYHFINRKCVWSLHHWRTTLLCQT